MLKETLAAELASLRNNKLFRELRPSAKDRESAHVLQAGKQLIDLSAGDPLALQTNSKLLPSIVRALEQDGLSSRSSRSGSGLSDYYLEVEQRIAQFFQSESAMIFPTRNQAYWTLISCLLREGDLVFFEEYARNPVVDAADMLGVSMVTFRKGDTRTFDERIGSIAGGRRCFVFAESVSSIDFEHLPTAWFQYFTSHPECYLVLDESAAVAHMGLRGAGLGEQLEVSSSPLVTVCDLSEGFGLPLTVLALPQVLYDYIHQHSRSVNREVPTPVPLLAAVDSLIDECALASSKREKLSEMTQTFASGLQAMGVSGALGLSPYVALTYDNLSLVRELKKGMFEQGLLAESILAPSEVKRHGAIQIRLNLRHSSDDISDILNGLDSCLKRLKVKPKTHLLQSSIQLA